jgi:hypothetical protein
MIVAIHQPQYLPWVPYLDKLACCDLFVYLDNVQFQKNGLQNRNQIKGTTGAQWLTVPVHATLSHTVGQTRIADARWRTKHIKSVETNYARARYASWFREELRPILEREWVVLADLNIAVTDCLLKWFGISCKRLRASELGVDGKADELVVNICSAVGADVYLSGRGARNYQDETKFYRRGIEVRYQSYENQLYEQCYPEIGFLPNLSALDLVLNAGPQARNIMLAGRDLSTLNGSS